MSLSVFEVSPEVSKPRAVLLFLHGVGASERAMASLAAAAPADCRRLLLRAPIALGPSAFAWFHVEFTDRGPILNEPEARASLQVLRDLVVAIRSESPGTPIFLIGFSQGAIVSLLAAVTDPQLVDGAICFSGRFPLEFAGDVQTPIGSQGTALWIGHGVHDQKLGIHFARQVKTLLEKEKYSFAYQEYPAQHEITPEMLADAYAWLERQL